MVLAQVLSLVSSALNHRASRVMFAGDPAALVVCGSFVGLVLILIRYVCRGARDWSTGTGLGA